jgi:phage N-6-adenine-methyltransferase
MRLSVRRSPRSGLRAAERAERTGQAAEDIRNAAVVAPEAQERLEERWWSAIDRATSRELLVEQYTGEVEWFTPTHIITAVRAVLGDIDLDPASCAAAQESVQAKRFYAKDDDGLARQWSGRVFLNPPYSAELVGRFVDKLVGHVRTGDVLAAILLVDSRSDTRWFHQAARSAQRVCFTFGRLKFVQPGGDAESPVSGSALFYFGPDTEVFEAKFGVLGLVYREPAFGAGRNDA